MRTMKALSIRQPWANLIVLAGKDIENRTWSTRYRGPVLIHAGQGMTYAELADAEAFASKALGRATAPSGTVTPGTLHRGGIVGTAEIVDCVRASPSPWFMGPWGFVLANAKPLPFRACKGQLGLFDVDLDAEEAAAIPAAMPVPSDLFSWSSEVRIRNSSERNRMQFRQYLATHLAEPTRIGDLARDAKQDRTFPDTNSLSVLEAYLQAYGAPPAAIETARIAWEMFKTCQASGGQLRATV